MPSPTMPRHTRDFYVTSARKLKLNNEFSWSDNKKNGRNLSTESVLRNYDLISQASQKFAYGFWRWHVSRKYETFFEILPQLEPVANFVWICSILGYFFVWEKHSKLYFFSLARLTKRFAYGFDRMLLEMALCQVSNETDGSKWSQNATLDFYTTVLASFLR